MHGHSAVGGEFLSTSKSFFLSAAAFGHVSGFTFWAAAILKLSMNQELYRTRQHQRDHAQHAKETGTLGQRSQRLYCLALPRLALPKLSTPQSAGETTSLCISVSLLGFYLVSVRGLLSGAPGRQLIIFISLFRSLISV